MNELHYPTYCHQCTFWVIETFGFNLGRCEHYEHLAPDDDGACEWSILYHACQVIEEEKNNELATGTS